MKIGITGISGFVGKNLNQYLDKFEIESINQYDLTSISLDYVAIVHLAGKAHDIQSKTNIDEYFQVNTELTIKLFDLFLKSNCRDFIFFSSIKAVADHVNEGIVYEHTPSEPKSPYGLSKRLAEEYILSINLPANKRVFILRPTMIHGPGNKGNLNLLFNLVFRRIPWPLGAFNNQRSFCSIDNVCFVIQELIKRDDIPSGIYNLADDDALCTNEVVRLVGSTLGVKSFIVSIPTWMIKTIAILGDLFMLPLNSERFNKLTENFVVSNDKIKAALHIREFPTSSKEGLKKTIRSFNGQI